MTDTKQPTFSDPYFKGLYDRLNVVEKKLVDLRESAEAEEFFKHILCPCCLGCSPPIPYVPEESDGKPA